MGIYKNIGVRKIAIYVIDAITLIRLYGLKDGLSVFRGYSTKKKNGFNIKAPFFRNTVFLRNNVSDQAIFRQVFLEQQYKLEEFFSLQAARIIDAGANIGCASLYFSKVFPTAEIIAIEPESSNFRLLTRNTAGYDNITCRQAALWGRNEMVSIANPEAEAASFMVQQTTESTIEGLTIDRILEERGWNNVDIVKIDIEGAEKEVFAENTNWLSKSKMLIVELHDRYKPGCTKTFFQSLEGLDYEAYFQHENIFIQFK